MPGKAETSNSNSRRVVKNTSKVDDVKEVVKQQEAGKTSKTKQTKTEDSTSQTTDHVLVQPVKGGKKQIETTTTPTSETVVVSKGKNKVQKQVPKAGGKSASKAGTKAVTKKASVKQSKDLPKDEKNERDENDEKDAVSETESEEEGNKSKFDMLVAELAETRKSIGELQKTEKLLIKKMSNAHKTEVKRAGNRKRRPNPDPTGFVVKKEIGGKLADWLQVERGAMMSGPEISKTFWKRIKEEGLQYEEDKRIFRTNKEVSKIFGVSDKVNKSTDPTDKEGFNMRTYQTHITHALTHHNA